MTHLEDAQLRATIATIPWWTPQDLMAFCRISKSGLEDLVQRGKLKRVRGIGKERLFCREEVMALLAENCASIIDERREKRGS